MSIFTGTTAAMASIIPTIAMPAGGATIQPITLREGIMPGLPPAIAAKPIAPRPMPATRRGIRQPPAPKPHPPATPPHKARKAVRAANPVARFKPFVSDAERPHAQAALAAESTLSTRPDISRELRDAAMYANPSAWDKRPESKL